MPRKPKPPRTVVPATAGESARYERPALWAWAGAFFGAIAGFAPVAAGFSTPPTASEEFWAVVTSVTAGALVFFSARAGGFALDRMRATHEPQREVPEVFVSHMSADRAWANWLERELNGTGYRLRIQAWRFQAEVDLVRRAYESLSEHNCVIVLVSHAYVASPYSAEEWTEALFRAASGIRLFVQISPCELPPVLSNRIDVDISDLDPQSARSAVVNGLMAHGVRPLPDASTATLPGGPSRFPGLGPEITNLPPRNLAFTGRVIALEEIHRSFLNTKVGVTARVVYGLGGVGKSQVALEYAHRYASDYDITWWVNASSEATLVPDLIALAIQLGVAPTNDQVQMIAGLWRALSQDLRFLILYNNANSAADLQDYWPRNGNGHILITSRSRVWGGLESQELPLLGREESITFLCLRARSRDESTAARIAERLGYLPLALEQAAAYVDGTQTTLAQYDEQLRRRPNDVLARARFSPHEQTLAATWLISVEQAERNGPGATTGLTLFAFLAPDEIPRSLVPSHARELESPLRELANDSIGYDLAVGALAAYSLIQADGDVLGVHRLVQAAVRQSLSSTVEGEWAQTALAILARAFPVDSTDIGTHAECARLLPHVLAAVNHAERLGLENPVVSEVLRRGGQYLHAAGELTRAKRLLNDALGRRERADGERSPAVAESLVDLARLAHHSSDTAELTKGRDYALRALALHESLHGPDDPQVASDLTDLGAILRALGDLTAAEEQTLRGLRIRVTAFGDEHPLVADSHHHLGYIHFAKGNLVAARAELELALRRREAALGPAHHDVGETLRLLGAVQRMVGDQETARITLERAVAVLRATDGPDGIETVAAENELADTYRGLGQVERSAALFDHVLEVRRARHDDHPYVAGTLIRRAGLSRATGALSQAEAELREGIQIYERTWGPDTASVADGLSRLGSLLHAQGQTNEARETLERAVRLCERTCGDHPYLAYALTYLAEVRRDMGDAAIAAELDARSAAVRVRCGLS